MEPAVRILYRKETFEVAGGQTLGQALERLGIAAESVMALRAGELIGVDCWLEPGDEVRLVGVIAGGVV